MYSYNSLCIRHFVWYMQWSLKWRHLCAGGGTLGRWRQDQASIYECALPVTVSRMTSGLHALHLWGSRNLWNGLWKTRWGQVVETKFAHRGFVLLILKPEAGSDQTRLSTQEKGDRRKPRQTSTKPFVFVHWSQLVCFLNLPRIALGYIHQATLGFWFLFPVTSFLNS